MLFWIALTSLVLVTICFWEVTTGTRAMTQLKDVPPLAGTSLPKVSVIIPACNEATTIEPALRSVLSLDYPDLEIIVVNDRSTDHTGPAIKKLQQVFPQLELLEISELPENWLGKSHALQTGAANACGEYLLFTDADIQMEKTTLRRAIKHLLDNNLDHLCMFFENSAPGGLLNTLLMEVGGGLLWLFKPWMAKNPESKYFIGVGAFNLVKASAYLAIGGHSSFPMHPIDDIMLGKILKRNNYRQECLLGYGFIQVPWYKSPGQLINGVMKNTFALYNYSISKVIGGVSAVFMLSIFPVWTFFFTSGSTRLLFAAIICVRLCVFALGLHEIGLPVRYAAWSLISPYFSCYISIKATLTTLINQGISWRGTKYPLAKLKKQPLL